MIPKSPWYKVGYAAALLSGAGMAVGLVVWIMMQD